MQPVDAGTPFFQEENSCRRLHSTKHCPSRKSPWFILLLRNGRFKRTDQNRFFATTFAQGIQGGRRAEVRQGAWTKPPMQLFSLAGRLRPHERKTRYDSNQCYDRLPESAYICLLVFTRALSERKKLLGREHTIDYKRAFSAGRLKIWNEKEKDNSIEYNKFSNLPVFHCNIRYHKIFVLSINFIKYSGIS